MLPIISLLPPPPFHRARQSAAVIKPVITVDTTEEDRRHDSNKRKQNAISPPFSFFTCMFTTEIYISPEQGVATRHTHTKKESPDSACSSLPSIKFSLFCPLPMMLGAKTNTGVGERLFCPIMRDETILPFFSFGETGETSLLGQDQQ